MLRGVLLVSCYIFLTHPLKARVGRNSKAYSAERKDIHTAHYVSLIRPCTTTQSILKQLRPATARVVPAEYTS